MEAVVSFEKALSLQPRDYEAWVSLAEARAALGQVEGEASAYQAAIQLRPSDAVAWLNLGISYTESGRMEEAEEAFTKAQEVAPQDPRPLLSLARHMIKMTRPSEVLLRPLSPFTRARPR